MKRFLGQTITSLAISTDGEDVLLGINNEVHTLYMSNHCCERRWFHSDDDLNRLVGKKLNRIEVRGIKVGYPADEAVLIIEAGMESVNIVAYNEHDGNYAGFELECIFVPGKLA